MVNEEKYEEIAKYTDFASNIHFFEFIQEEFKGPSFKVEKYAKEIEDLTSRESWAVGELAEFLREHPKSYEIFEEVFQLARFTNAQLIHFLFDTKILNSVDKDTLIDYLKKNLIYDKLFFTTFISLFKKSTFKELKFKPEFNDKDRLVDFIDSVLDEEIKKHLIMLLKITVIKYVEHAVKKVNIIHDRLTNENFVDISDRMANYLINNLNLNGILKQIELKGFLETKRVPIDTKSIHGNFGRIKILSILKKHDFVDINELLDKNNVKTLPHDLTRIPELREVKEKFLFVSERYVEGINKRKDGKPKKFDFVLIYDTKPKILIETNFYSTAGTKIGINIGEYVDLDEDIKKNFKQFIFMWITDGNYWLSPAGKNTLLNLYNYFGDNILNYNLLNKRLEEIKNFMKEII